MYRCTLLMVALFLALAGCARLQDVGRAPDFTPTNEGPEYDAMVHQPLPVILETPRVVDTASLWSGSRGSLLGDRRAVQQGDILTVVIEINDKAEISNSTNRARNGSESLSIPDFFGIPSVSTPVCQRVLCWIRPFPPRPPAVLAATVPSSVMKN